MTTNSDDPYQIAKSKIESAVGEFTIDFDDWKQQLETTNTAKNKKFKELTDSLKGQYKDIRHALKEIRKSAIDVVRSNRENYPHISNGELEERDRFVSDMKTEIDECRQQMQSKRTKEIIEEHKRKLEKERNNISPLSKVATNINQNRIDDSKQQLLEERKEQDEIFDDMLNTLKRLGVHGGNIVAELEDQNRLLDEVDDEMDIASDRLTRLTNKLDELMNHSEGKKIGLIILLVIILVVMVYFMI